MSTANLAETHDPRVEARFGWCSGCRRPDRVVQSPAGGPLKGVHHRADDGDGSSPIAVGGDSPSLRGHDMRHCPAHCATSRLDGVNGDDGLDRR